MNRNHLQAALAVGEVADNCRARRHVAVTRRLQCAGVTEGVSAIVECDETVTLGGVKPLHLALRRGLRNGLLIPVYHCEPTLLAPAGLDTPRHPPSRPREGNCDMMTTETTDPQPG